MGRYRRRVGATMPAELLQVERLWLNSGVPAVFTAALDAAEPDCSCFEQERIMQNPRPHMIRQGARESRTGTRPAAKSHGQPSQIAGTARETAATIRPRRPLSQPRSPPKAAGLGRVSQVFTGSFLRSRRRSCERRLWGWIDVVPDQAHKLGLSTLLRPQHGRRHAPLKRHEATAMPMPATAVAASTRSGGVQFVADRRRVGLRVDLSNRPDPGTAAGRSNRDRGSVRPPGTEQVLSERGDGEQY